MKSYFGDDKKRINHALSVLFYAEKIYNEEGGSLEVIVSSAILHDIGIHEAEKKHNSASGKYQEIEGPPIARNIMEKLKISDRIIDKTCEIIAHHHSPGSISSINFHIVCDADLIVNMSDECNLKNKEKIEVIIDKSFLTKTGKQLAKAVFITKNEVTTQVFRSQQKTDFAGYK